MMPTLTWKAEGWKNDEDESVLTVQPVCTTEGSPTSSLGDYTITIGGAEAANYDITYVNGKLTVSVPVHPAGHQGAQQVRKFGWLGRWLLHREQTQGSHQKKMRLDMMGCANGDTPHTSISYSLYVMEYFTYEKVNLNNG